LAEATEAKENAETALSELQKRLAIIETALKASEATFQRVSDELDILRQVKLLLTKRPHVPRQRARKNARPTMTRARNWMQPSSI